MKPLGSDNMKRFLALLIAFLLVVNCSVSVAATESEELLWNLSDVIYMDYNIEDIEKTEDDFVFVGSTPYYYNYNIKGYIYSAYTTLSALEKELYDAFLSGLQNGETSMKVQYSPVLTAEQFKSIDFKKLLEAFGLDHPEFFYVTSYKYVWSSYRDGSVDSIILYPTSTSLYDKSVNIYDLAQISTYVQDLNSKITSISLDTSNRYNFVKSLHDYLCNNITYINNKARCHDAYGSLVEGESVCQGYADAFKLICDYYKIPSVCLTGTGNGGAHMWNAVQMDDGNWYLLDLTWDDQGSRGTFYDFFLVGLNTVDTSFGKKAFSVSHISDGAPYLPVLPYSNVKYSQTQHNTEFGATYNSLAKKDGRYLIRSPFDVEYSNTYYNGMYVEIENPVTNSDFTVPSGTGGNSEVWTLVLLGDCDGDGLADVSDFSEAVNRVMANSDIGDAYDMAADMNCDGYLDVIDLAMLSVVANELDTEIVIQ